MGCHFLGNELERLQQLFRAAPGFICVLSGQRHVYELANDAYYQLIGHRKIIGCALAEVLPEVIWQGFVNKLDRVYKTGQPFIGRAVPIKLQRSAGGELEERFIDLTYEAIRDRDNQIVGVFAQGHDVTEAHELAQMLARQAAQDPLTGLLNRREFARQLESLDDEQPTAVLYIDVDHFKIINDRSGHAAGDALLIQIADALQANISCEHLLARIGGDEFALILPRATAQVALEMAHRMRAAVNDLHPIFTGRRYSVSLSIGISIGCPGDGLTFADVLNLADAACILAKEKGRNRVQLSLPTDEEIMLRRGEMDGATHLMEAIREGQVVLYAQRIFSMDLGSEGDPNFYEVLARLREADGSIRPPGSFIPAAERFGLIDHLDRHIIEKVFAHLRKPRRDSITDVCYFVNVSALTLSSPEFPSFIGDLLVEYPDVSPGQICFEVTETAVISNMRRVCHMMNRLVEVGFRFALDDFGSGMASFAYLQDMPVHFVKIDGQFIRGILDRPAGADIVEAVARVARAMNMKTIAESVEVLELLPHLRTLGIDYGQGFALHHPEPI
ncbi:diguanylate cyclase (GGDEF)-like protein [Cereibacter changlensis]|nr:diguanylate cyclase (GGDEF)-like protein [Cereibacter changlensis]